MIETKRTYIRPVELSDNMQIFGYRSDSETNKYQGWVPKTVEEVDEFIAKIPKTFNETGTWFQLVIIEKETEMIIGDIGIHFIDEHQVEVGITLGKKSHSKGLATEALKSVIDHLFKELGKHRVVTSIDPLNIGSIKLVERLNLRKEAHFKESLLINGEWVDDIVYAALSSEWK